MLNIAVLVSGGGTNLQAIIDAEARGEIKSGSLALVLSSRADAYALERSEKAGIPTLVIPHKECRGEAEFNSKILSALKERNIDVVVLAGFMHILNREVIAAYNDRIINVHPSLIPSFCGKGFYGLKVHEAALERGVKLTGATVHLVNEIPDGGRILLQKAVAVEDGDTPETLQRRVMEQAEWQLLPQALARLCDELAINPD